MSLPFAVTFYGASYDAIWVSENGLVFFGATGAATAAAPVGCLPSADAPNNAIYVLAADLRPASAGQVYVHRADAKTFVVTWLQMYTPAGTAPNSVQLVFRNRGPLTANYLALEPTPAVLIGVENDDGTVAQQIACQGEGRALAAGDSVQFGAVLPWQ